MGATHTSFNFLIMVIAVSPLERWFFLYFWKKEVVVVASTGTSCQENPHMNMHLSAPVSFYKSEHEKCLFCLVVPEK